MRYEVRLGMLDGTEHVYNVVSFMGLPKAVALAASEHERIYPNSQTAYTVKVKEAEVPFTDGMHQTVSTDLVDRQEW